MISAYDNGLLLAARAIRLELAQAMSGSETTMARILFAKAGGILAKMDNRIVELLKDEVGGT